MTIHPILRKKWYKVRALMFGAGGIFHRYLEGFLPYLETGSVELVVVSLEPAPPIRLPRNVQYVPADQFWQFPQDLFKRRSVGWTSCSFDSAIIAVPPDQISKVTTQVLENNVAQLVFLEKPPSIDWEGEYMLEEVERRHPNRTFCLGHYHRKPVFRKLYEVIDKLKPLMSVEMSILEKKMIEPNEVAAHAAGILTCFICHALYCFRDLGLQRIYAQKIRAGRYRDALLPKDVETLALIEGLAFHFSLTPKGPGAIDRVDLRIALGKGLWDEKILELRGEGGVATANFASHLLTIETGGKRHEIQCAEDDDAYHMIVKEIMYHTGWHIQMVCGLPFDCDFDDFFLSSTEIPLHNWVRFFFNTPAHDIWKHNLSLEPSDQVVVKQPFTYEPQTYFDLWCDPKEST